MNASPNGDNRKFGAPTGQNQKETKFCDHNKHKHWHSATSHKMYYPLMFLNYKHERVSHSFVLALPLSQKFWGNRQCVSKTDESHPPAPVTGPSMSEGTRLKTHRLISPVACCRKPTGGETFPVRRVFGGAPSVPAAAAPGFGFGPEEPAGEGAELANEEPRRRATPAQEERRWRELCSKSILPHGISCSTGSF